MNFEDRVSIPDLVTSIQFQSGMESTPEESNMNAPLLERCFDVEVEIWADSPWNGHQSLLGASDVDVVGPVPQPVMALARLRTHRILRLQQLDACGAQ